MRGDRQQRLAARLTESGATAALLLGTTNVRWATGARVVAADQGRSAHFRNVAVCVRGDHVPHLFTHYRDGVPAGYPDDHVHAGVDVESDAGAAAIVSLVGDFVRAPASVFLDEWTMALRRSWAALGDVSIVDAPSQLMSPLRVIKSADERACIRRAQSINEEAMVDVYTTLRPGVRQNELSAVFLRRVMELGADQNTVDPIWQVMPPSVAMGPYTATGGLVFPVPSANCVLEQGDVIWVDTGITVHGYDSDFGRTWITGAEPTPVQRDQFRRWSDVVHAVLDVVKPGATGRDLTRAAGGAHEGGRPWLPHLYLAHGIGCDSAEAPFIGTDLGDTFDESIVLTPGMVFVLEPIAWTDGTGGYRGEEIVAVTDTGYELLSDHPYDPYAA
jgi:Xaa-Pro aminopeptidase